MEEEGTLWLWAWPELLGWDRPISWLFSPVVGQNFPGDLWGVDDLCNAIVVETKRAKGKAGQDPFEDFIAYSGTVVTVPPVSELRKRWKRLLQDERSYLKGQAANLEHDQRAKDTFPGVVPYSMKRRVVWNWRKLYLAKIAPRIEAEEYEKVADRRLERRSEDRTNGVHFFAMFTVLPEGAPTFSAVGRKNMERLSVAAGNQGVHVRAVQASKDEGKTLFRSWRPVT